MAFFLIFSVVLGLLNQLQIFSQLYLIELLVLLTGQGLLKLWYLIYPRLLTGFGMLVFFTNLKVMKQAASWLGNVLAAKMSKLYNVKKSCSILTYILLKLGKWPPAWKAFLSTCCCKNETEIGFLTVRSSWGYQHGFSAEASQVKLTEVKFQTAVSFPCKQ